MTGKLAYCETCKMSQKPSSCKSKWSLRLYVESVGSPQEKLRLSVFNDMMHKFQDVCGLDDDMSEEKIVEAILLLSTVNSHMIAEILK